MLNIKRMKRGSRLAHGKKRATQKRLKRRQKRKA